MAARQVVLDTCVLVAALRSKRGASHRLIQSVGRGRFQINLSVGLVLEYEAAAMRARPETGLSAEEIRDIIDYLCKTGNHVRIHYLWRPVLPDPDDDMLLELAWNAGCDCIVTFDRRGFSGAAAFGIAVLTPGELLRQMGEER
jgi:putative PIN family toxin of toxin-antitoxin system